jgi:hypothetical protein
MDIPDPDLRNCLTSSGSRDKLSTQIIATGEIDFLEGSAFAPQ